MMYGRPVLRSTDKYKTHLSMTHDNQVVGSTASIFYVFKQVHLNRKHSVCFKRFLIAVEISETCRMRVGYEVVADFTVLASVYHATHQMKDIPGKQTARCQILHYTSMQTQQTSTEAK